MSLVLRFWKWLVFWLGDKWSRFMADSKQKCLNRIVGDTRIGEFWFREKWSGIYFFFTWKAKNQWILSINAVSPEIAKRRILAALWRSPVLQILQTENLKRKNTRVFRVFSIHKSLYINALKQKWWPDPESNWGHGDFQSPALPTELTCHFLLNWTLFDSVCV